MNLRGNPGNKGNVNAKGGSRKAPEMLEFYAKLDAACLTAVDYLHEIVKEAQKPKNFRQPTWLREGVNAAGKLLMKAPERVEGNLEGNFEITWATNGDNKDEDNALCPKTVATSSS